jgi:hypothetical protein
MRAAVSPPKRRRIIMRTPTFQGRISAPSERAAPIGLVQMAGPQQEYRYRPLAVRGAGTLVLTRT